MKLARLLTFAAVSSFVGCTLLVDTDGLSTPEAPLAPATEAGRDVAAIPDARVDAAPEDASPPDATPVVDSGPDVTTPPLRTTVSCDQPKSCADREGCCVVYGGANDFCTASAAACTFGASRVVLVACDDETDCTALGQPGTICCATLEPNNTLTAVACVPREQCAGVQLCDAQLQKCPEGKTCVKGAHASDIWACE